MIAFRIGLRIVGLFVMTLALAQCGDDGGGGDNGSDFGSPPPGTFIGALADGGSIRLEVGSIEAIAFTCDDQSIQESFSPPRPIDTDGTFGVEFTDAGRKFQVRGEFENDDLVRGTIDDQDNDCDTTFTATRSGGSDPSPTRTSTPVGGTPPTPTLTPTTVGSGPTQTRTPTPVCTSSCAPPTEPTVEPTEPPCPVAVEIVGNAGSAGVLDSGWTGLAHGSTVVSDGTLTLAVACSGTTRPCGVCDVSGPIQNLNADTGDINPHRCSNDTSKKCTDNTACTAPGTCEFFFGAPLPLSAGQISTCVVNRIASAVTGTMNVETGVFATTLSLRSSVYTGALEEPCPRCQNDPTPNDGTAGGTCTAGTRSGQPCDENGSSPVPSFGSTSLDCPPVPGSIVANLPIALDGSSATEKETLSASSPNCEAKPALKCFCPNAGNNPQQPNACLDDTSTPEPACVPVSPGSNKGQCEGGPIDGICKIESFRGCTTEQQATQCPAPGDSCLSVLRPCYLDNGLIGGSIEARGMADPPDSSGTSTPVFASIFCIPPTTSVAVNAAGGLPGVGRIELPLITKQIYALP